MTVRIYLSAPTVGGGLRIQPGAGVSDLAEALFLIGSPETNEAVRQAATPETFPKLSDQGIVLRRTELQKCPALIVGGGSARATLWAVYELVERWGVRYLMHGDVLPRHAGAFVLPELNIVKEPILRVRAHPTIQDFACSGEAWGFADFRLLIDQLAKLKFTRMSVNAFGWQPFLHWQCQGIKRQSFWLWYDEHYPITPDMAGRELFGDADEFWNPDLPPHGSYEESAAAGERLVHGIMEHAHRRGMECSFYVDVTQFPPEFAPLLKDAQTEKFSHLTIVPGAKTGMDDPQYYALASAVLQAALKTYPEADILTVGMPEWRQWVGAYQEAWQALDAKYELSKVRTLEQVLADAEHRKWYRQWSPGMDGVKKAMDEVKGDIALLYFYDRLLQDPQVLQVAPRPAVKFMYGCVAEEMHPLLGRLLPSGSALDSMVDNFPTHVLKRRDVLHNVPGPEIQSVQNLTLDDDNIGVVPQLSTGVLHQLMGDLHRYGWAGFVARERFPGDHDTTLTCLAKAAWDADITPEEIIRDQLRAVCGENCADDMLAALREVETVTALFETNGLFFAFPVKEMLRKYWDEDQMAFYRIEYLVEVRHGYLRALEAARRAQARARTGVDNRAAASYIGYWVGRLEFAVKYVETVQAVRRAALAELARNRDVAVRELNEALQTLRQSLQAYAHVARNPTDRGTIALMNEYCYRWLKAKLTELTCENKTSKGHADAEA